MNRVSDFMFIFAGAGAIPCPAVRHVRAACIEESIKASDRQRICKIQW